MHRIRNEKLPSSISNMFKIRINDRYDLRSNDINNYDLGKPETNFMKKSFSYSATSLYGMTYQLQQKKKALALTNLNVYLTALDSIWELCKYLFRNRIYSETNVVLVVHAITKFVVFSLSLCMYLCYYIYSL